MTGLFQMAHDAKVALLELAGMVGHICMIIGVLMLLFSFINGQFQPNKVLKAGVVILVGAVLMNFAQGLL